MEWRGREERARRRGGGAREERDRGVVGMRVRSCNQAAQSLRWKLQSGGEKLALEATMATKRGRGRAAMATVRRGEAPALVPIEGGKILQRQDDEKLALEAAMATKRESCNGDCGERRGAGAGSDQGQENPATAGRREKLALEAAMATKRGRGRAAMVTAGRGEAPALVPIEGGKNSKGEGDGCMQWQRRGSQCRMAID